MNHARMSYQARATRPAKQPRRPGRERGQSLVEFAVMSVALLTLLMGVLDLARAYFTYLALKDAAGEGAYYASAFPECVDANGINDDALACAGQNTIDYRVVNSAPQGGLVNWADASADIDVDLPCGSSLPCDMEAGETLTVTVAYNYQMLTPFISGLAPGGTLTLTARSSAVIIRVPDCTDAAGCR